MLFNKKKRIQYLGFDDFWFSIAGILVLSIVTDYIFSNSFSRMPFAEALIHWSVSLLFTIGNWFIIRRVMIFLRKKYPSFQDNPKRIALFFLAIVGTVLLVDTIGNILIVHLLDENYNPAPRSKVMVPVVIVSTMTMSIYEAIYFYIRLKKSVRDEEQSKQAIVQAQLDALKNQAQPHFLFNSLNTLRDIIDQNTKQEAKEFVDKLSDVYRFILDSGNANLIPLRDELRFAKAYIHIQTERFGNNLQLKWNIPDAALPTLIVPMSLQILLENAIKHNVVSKAKPLVVTIAVKENQLSVTNKIQAKSTRLPSTKLGLKNIEKRYGLISNQSVAIKNDGSEFVVVLPLLTSADQKKDHASIDNRR